jgi:hypothetical protein
VNCGKVGGKVDTLSTPFVIIIGMNYSKLFSLKKEDWINSIVHALATAVVMAVGSAIGQEGFSVFSADWVNIGKSVVDTAIAVFIASLGINYSANSEGKVLGVKVK